MKKLFAILMSMLLLCSMIPFAAVSAAGEYSIELVADAEEVNAGDEVAVEVSMYGHEDLGLIGAQIELGFDPDVFELVTYYDEDEEMWMPPIEVGPKFSASSNKYILFSPIDEETGYMERCLVQFLRSTASATQAVKTNLFYTVTFKVKDTAPSGTYEINVINHNDKNIVFYGLGNNPWSWEPISITVNGSEPEVPECEHEYTYPCDQICSKCYELTNPDAAHSVKHVDAVEATCYEDGNIEYWYCEYCGVAWADEALTMQTNLKSVVVPMGHGTITHVAAKEPTCFENGNIEYWYCEDCGQAWLDEACTLNTNLRAVVLPMAHDELTHVAAKEPTCTEEGNIEYWYCEACGMAWLDAEGTLNTNLQAVKLAPSCKYNAVYTAAKEANCFEEGNVEYWYCDICDVYYLDADCTIITNAKSVILPVSHNVIHVEAKEPTCFENGNIEYWYCDICGQAWLDEYCHLNTNLKAVVLPMAHDELTHVEAKEPTCTEEGNIEYWYCEACGMAWLDAEGTLNTNLQAVKLAPSCKYNAVHTAAKEANCFEEGNVEYWYCETCDVYYLDADCTIITNAKSVILPVSHNVIHVEAKEPTCFENGNIEYWYCDICGQAWLDEYCHLNTNLKAVVLPMAHDELTHVEAKEPTCTEEGNIEYWYCEACGMAWLDAEGTLNTNLQAVKLAPSCKYNAVHTAAKEANCFEEGNVEYWYCETCDVYYLDADCTIITNAKSVILPVSHNVIHVDAVEPTCFENGNIEYWYCDICGQAWLDEYCHLNTNLKAVVLPMAHDELTHVAAVEPTCTEEGNIEYWYCESCGMAWLDAEGTLNTNLQAVKLAPSCKYNAVYTAAKEANCFEEGNVEYWYCETCDVYYADADCTIITNAKNVILPVSHNVIHVEAKDATCTELGNIEYWYCDICGSAWLDEYCHLNTNLRAVVLPMADHTYDDDMDVDCNVCGDIRVIEYEVKTFGGNSIAESNDGLSGLAFKFSLTDKITGMAVVEGTKYVADYSNAYVTPDSTGTYKLVKMGAKVSNGKQTLDIPVKKIVLEGEGAPYYAIRIINIPEDQLSTLISCTPYFVYEDAAGQKVTVELDSYTACAADFMG